MFHPHGDLAEFEFEFFALSDQVISYSFRDDSTGPSLIRHLYQDELMWILKLPQCHHDKKIHFR